MILCRLASFSVLLSRPFSRAMLCVGLHSFPLSSSSSSSLFFLSSNSVPHLSTLKVPWGRPSYHGPVASHVLLRPMNAPLLYCPVACKAMTSGSHNTSSNSEVMVQHILVKEDQLQLLLDLQRRLIQEAADFSELASEHSICSSKDEGGMLGWIQRGKMIPEFEEAAFNAPLNKLTRVRTKHGWHLFQVLAQREASFLKEIQPEELHSLLQDSRFLDEAQLMDVREPSESSAAAIEGFKLYPLSQFGRWAPTITEDLDPQKDTYLMCHHGIRSLQAAQWLQTQGFCRLYNVAGGIHAYSLRANNSIPVY